MPPNATSSEREQLNLQRARVREARGKRHETRSKRQIARGKAAGTGGWRWARIIGGRNNRA
eukprot:11914104-Alexandrium_andersonii.AAC.1